MELHVSTRLVHPSRIPPGSQGSLAGPLVLTRGWGPTILRRGEGIYRNDGVAAIVGNLRIIGGEKRGFRISSTGARDLRPTAARVREAVFDILRDRIRDSRFLDLFAGTGAVGLEALSRGAGTCVFVETQRQAIDLIRRNLERCGFNSQATVLRGTLPACLSRVGSPGPFDLVYVDPPYGDAVGERVLRALGNGSLLHGASWVVFEHRRSWSPPGDPVGLRIARAIRQGDTVLSIFHKVPEAPPGEPPTFDHFPA